MMPYRDDIEQAWDADILAAEEEYKIAARASLAKGGTIEGASKVYIDKIDRLRVRYAGQVRTAEYKMRPLPWSPSGLEDFVNCPKAYCEKKVRKTIVEEQTEQQIWGTWVHKQFEERLANGVVLPAELAVHEPYLKRLEDKPGHFFCEIKGGLDKKGGTCSWDHKANLWARLVIDYLKVNEVTCSATIADYKTGRPHQKFRQLSIYAIHTFLRFEFVDLINCQYYWTKTQEVTKKVYSRDDVPLLWAALIPDLKQYKEAFQTDIWQARKSGLCKGWCPVKDCENWEPKRK